MFKIGKVSKYYDKVGIAIIDLDGDIAIGDTVKFVDNGHTLFEQKITEIQVGHQKPSSAKRGDLIGIKTSSQVSDGFDVFKI